MASLQAELAELIQVNQDLWATNFSTGPLSVSKVIRMFIPLSVAAFAMVLYDMIITMDQEVRAISFVRLKLLPNTAQVEYVWRCVSKVFFAAFPQFADRSKWSLPKVAYLVNRWIGFGLVLYASNFILSRAPTQSRCLSQVRSNRYVSLGCMKSLTYHASPASASWGFPLFVS